MLHALLFIFTYAAGMLASLRISAALIFVVYQAVYFFNPTQRWWDDYVPNLSYSFFTVLLMLFFIIFKWNSLRPFHLWSSQLKWAYCLLVLYGLAYFYAWDPEHHFKFLDIYLNLMVTITAAYLLCDTARKIDWYLWGYIFGAWYLSFYIFQIGRNEGDRVERVGTVDAPDSNGVAAALVPSLVLCLYYFWISKKLHFKALFAIAGVFIANALVLINSRASFLAAVASIGLFMAYMYFSSFQRPKQRLTAVFITVAGLAGGVSLMDDTFIQRMESIQNETEVDPTKETGATRMVYWQAAWEMAKDYPFGNGFRGYNYLARFYVPADVNTGNKVSRSVHSSWFEALSEIGYPGLFCLLMMIFSSFLMTRKCKKILKQQGMVDEYFKIVAMECALFAFMVSMSFMNRFRAEILYWCVLFIACAYKVYVLKQQTSLSPRVANSKDAKAL